MLCRHSSFLLTRINNIFIFMKIFKSKYFFSQIANNKLYSSLLSKQSIITTRVIDPLYQTYPISTSLSQNDEHLIKMLYYNVLKLISNEKSFQKEEINNFFEERFWKQALASNQLLRENKLKLEIKSSEGELENAVQKQGIIQIEPVGYLEIHGLNIDRRENQFIHCYTMEQKESQLVFSLKKQFNRSLEEEKEILKKKIDEQMKSNKMTSVGKQEELKKEVKDMLEEKDQEQQNTLFRKFGRQLLSAVGMEKQFFGKDLDLPDVMGQIKDFQQNALRSINRIDKYILVEDFLVFSKNIKINVHQDEGEILCFDDPLCPETQQTGVDASNSSIHFLRTQCLIDPKDPPSTRNNKSRKISDFNGLMRGNLPCLIKNFEN